MQPITLHYPARPITRSLVTGWVTDCFGLCQDRSSIIVADNLHLDIHTHELVLFTGPSGSGKSSILREVSRQFHAADLLSFPLPEVPLVDAIPGPWEERVALLASCGLSEARVLLRSPSQLSDGQRMRFRLAYGMAQNAPTLMVDEFTAALDRPLAKVLCANVRRMVTRTGRGLFAATTHEDIVADLNPDVHVHCAGDGRVTVTRREGVKKKILVTPRSCGLAKVPEPTGRTSLGGITGGTGWALCDA